MGRASRHLHLPFPAWRPGAPVEQHHELLHAQRIPVLLLPEHRTPGLGVAVPVQRPFALGPRRGRQPHWRKRAHLRVGRFPLHERRHPQQPHVAPGQPCCGVPVRRHRLVDVAHRRPRQLGRPPQRGDCRGGRWPFCTGVKGRKTPRTNLRKSPRTRRCPSGGCAPTQTTRTRWPKKKKRNRPRPPPLFSPTRVSRRSIRRARRDGNQLLSITGITSINTSSPASSGSLGRMMPARLGALNSRLTSSASRLLSMSTKNLLLNPISMSSPR